MSPVPPPDPSARLRFLARVVRRQAEHLRRTAERLATEELGPEHLARLEDLPELAERLDAFAARFGRLQDLLGDKLLPAALAALGETPGPALDNLDRAERFGWLDSADRWMEIRRLRNRLVHEYVEDPRELAEALAQARAFVPVLLQTAERLLVELERRGLLAESA